MVQRVSSLSVILVLLLFFLSPSVTTQADEINRTHIYTDTLEINDEIFQGELIKTERYDIISIDGPSGNMVATRDTAKDEYINLETDYLTAQEEQVQLDALNASSIQQTDLEPETIAASRKTIGKWYYGKWKSYTVDFADKATTTALAVLILGKIPYLGGVAATAATIAIAHGMKTGYFKAKKDYKIISGSYMMEKSHLKIYKKKNYTGFIRYVSGTRKIWIN